MIRLDLSSDIWEMSTQRDCQFSSRFGWSFNLKITMKLGTFVRSTSRKVRVWIYGGLPLGPNKKQERIHKHLPLSKKLHSFSLKALVFGRISSIFSSNTSILPRQEPSLTRQFKRCRNAKNSTSWRSNFRGKWRIENKRFHVWQKLWNHSRKMLRFGQ